MPYTLERLDAVPIFSQDFTFEFNQWLTQTVDIINHDLQTLETNQLALDATLASLDARITALGG